ncbi:MAG: AAA family ATPase [Planctomycetota bacterium]
MGKKKNKKNKSAIKTTQAAGAAPKHQEEELDNIEMIVRAQATETDFENLAVAPPPSQGENAEALIKRASETLALLEIERKRLEEAKTQADRREEKVEELALECDQKITELKQREDDYVQKDKELAERDIKLQEQEQDILKRHEDIVRRELDADAGFIRRSREALVQLEVEGEELRVQLSSRRKQIDDEREEFERELQEKREQLKAELNALRDAATQDVAAAREASEAELASKRTEFEKRRKDLVLFEANLRKRERELNDEQEIIAEDRTYLEERVAQLSARKIEHMESEIQGLVEQLKAAREDRDSARKSLAEREEAILRFGGETPEAVLKRLQTLEAERDALKKTLGERPSAQAAQRLEGLERQKEQWESERLKMQAEIGEARQDSARRLIAVTELESLRDQKLSLESANALLHEAHRQLRAEADELIKGADGKSPFPACSEMDSNNVLQSTINAESKIRDLKAFAEYVRNRMALDPLTRKELYYSQEDVRSFLGGLAMSRLHLLQGISGTGKTSLPLAFARAIGAESALIEVQAGWRNRQDLIGHYNAFEKRFYETEFLKALYKASTPRYRDTPFFVVLDEMNLSHPEQYFADLLSALEQDQELQRLVLMTAAVDPAPSLLGEGGTKLQIPRNVWFIGTANHDETTKDFADKTYDRAHVMELPRNYEKFELQAIDTRRPTSIDALTDAFKLAEAKHKDDAAKSYAFLHDELSDILGSRFRVGWGNRLERQMSSYVPVVVAAGGTIGEATDHILATKLLRKIRDRYDTRPEDIRALKERIRIGWKMPGEPVKSLELLQQESTRLGDADA